VATTLIPNIIHAELAFKKRKRILLRIFYPFFNIYFSLFLHKVKKYLFFDSCMKHVFPVIFKKKEKSSVDKHYLNFNIPELNLVESHKWLSILITSSEP